MRFFTSPETGLELMRKCRGVAVPKWSLYAIPAVFPLCLTHGMRGRMPNNGTIMKSPFKLSLIYLAILASAASAEEIPLYRGDEIVVTATRIPYSDADAPYASEVHTHAMIEQSGAVTLFDYLAQHTSVQVLPGYGNKFTPLIDMRGYGIGDGYQNVVVSLDGQRLNNIDGVPQLIGAIPLASIDRIEITQGSGSVMYGDGATAGSIQIYTRPYDGVSVGVSAGNSGALAGTLAAGFARENVALSASADTQSLGGYGDADATGHKDASRLDTQRARLSVRPFERAWLNFDGSSSRIDIRYVNPMTLAQFQANPAQNGGNPYTQPVNAYPHQVLETNQWRLGTDIELSRQLKLSVSHNREDKLADNLSYGYKFNYDYAANDLALVYKGDALDITAGTQTFDGTRIGLANRTSKNNSGYYVQGQYRLDSLTLSLGARRENVEYDFVPATGTALHDARHLSALDMGLNYRLSRKTTLFANYNQSFQAPDIDRFFNFDGTFNAFIVPAEAKTLTAGFSHVENNNRLKLDVFRANLKNEIFFDPLTFTNTNIDRSHKYGLELQDSLRVGSDLSLSANYTYTRAIIDHEINGGGAFNGKDLPGVPRHGLILGLGYNLTGKSALNLNQTWRSTAYAAEDFANSFSQKQAAYQSTDLAYRYRDKAYEWSASIDNLFAHQNGLWVHDDAIYPVGFTRNFRLGFKAGL